MKRTFIVVVGTLVLFQLVLAQAPPRAPKPGPEHKRMAYFAGNWTVEGEMKASPFGPGGRSEERRVGKECRSRWSPYH